MFLDSKEYYDSKRHFRDTGLKTAFECKNFGAFPIHDPTAGRTRTLGAEFEQHYRHETNYWRAFSVPNVAYYYLFLILSSVAIALILL
jgi:hypothetical protein